MKWDGEFRLSADERDITWMADGARLSISDGLVFAAKAELRNVNGAIERSYSKNGVRRDWEPEGREFLATALDRLIRHSGMFAKDRVARFLKQGGPDAVLAEIDRLDDSSYIRRVYYSELIKQATVSEPLLTRILQRVPNELSSDYDKATLFTAIAKLPAMGESHKILVAKASKSISSDYDQRRTLSAILDANPLPPALAAAVIDAASAIGSNYDRSLVLTEVVERGGLTTSTSTAFMSLVRDISSSYDQRRVLTAVSAQRSIPDVVAADAIKTAGAMTGGSHDRTETLITLVNRGGLNDGSADAFFQSASQISSSYDLSRLLQRVANQGEMSPKVLEGVLRTAARVTGAYDRANVLELVASRARLQGAARDLYVAATRGMSSYEENRVLAALVRAEGRR